MYKRLEDEIREFFSNKFPFSLLSNIILYRNDRDTEDLFANEIDYLFHYKRNGKDYLVVVEVKQRKIYGDSSIKKPTSTSQWLLNYDGKIKNIKKQVLDQGTALKQFCRNIDSRDPAIQHWIIDLRAGVANVITDIENPNLKLLTLDGFKEEISKTENVIKVEQSTFLKEIRKGIPSQELGHPEVNNAIQFIKICRQSLDDQIFRFFQPKSRFYALNGCAGMGKSVLLAYSIFVFGTGHAVYTKDDGSTVLETFKKNGELPPQDIRWIFVYAVKKKQIDILKSYYESIFKQIEQMANSPLPRIQPIFKEWKSEIDEKCNILIIDEAHDLYLRDQRLIANWLNGENSKFENKYLLVACDRNQAPKRQENEQNIIEGINFSGHSTRLNRIYRCPFSVYVASIGLLFRWFARKGPRVVLSSEKFREHFGFKPKVTKNEESMMLTMRNDCHPGNNWQQTVDLIENCSMMHSHLSQFNFDRHEVLWACFEKMEPDFDYTEISQKYTYVDLRGDDVGNEIDKNIKGQEFPIVVVEGLPKQTNLLQLITTESREDSISDSEKEMWNCRKNIYITCSRASAFLYFISNKETSSPENLEELEFLMKQVNRSARKKHSSGQSWSFDIRESNIKRLPSIFKDVENDVQEDIDKKSVQANDSLKDVEILAPNGGNKNQRSPIIVERKKSNNIPAKIVGNIADKIKTIKKAKVSNIEDQKKPLPVHSTKNHYYTSANTIEVCKNKASGKYSIFLKDIDYGRKFEVINEEGTKIILESVLFHEIETVDREKFLSDYSITENQLLKYDYYRKQANKGKNKISGIVPRYRVQNDRIYESRVKNAKARMVIRNDSYVILKGSTALNETKKSFSPGNLKLRDELIQSGAMVLNKSGLYEFSRDVEFKSSSAAACIIAGSSRSGPHDFGCN